MNLLKNSKEIDYKKTATSIVKFNFTLFFSSKFHICKRKILKCITRKIYLLSRIIYFCKFLKCKCFWISEYYNDSTHKKFWFRHSFLTYTSKQGHHWWTHEHQACPQQEAEMRPQSFPFRWTNNYSLEKKWRMVEFWKRQVWVFWEIDMKIEFCSWSLCE